nr:MAG TPA: hypothetical protein [Caudoviricetes sp.]
MNPMPRRYAPRIGFPQLLQYLTSMLLSQLLYVFFPILHRLVMCFFLCRGHTLICQLLDFVVHSMNPHVQPYDNNRIFGICNDFLLPLLNGCQDCLIFVLADHVISIRFMRISLGGIISEKLRHMCAALIHDLVMPALIMLAQGFQPPKQALVRSELQVEIALFLFCHVLISFTACHLQCAAAILRRPGFLPVSANLKRQQWVPAAGVEPALAARR